MIPTDTIEDDWAWIETDSILPTSIEHCCQEHFNNRGLREKYNFLVYRFEREGVELSCRAYMDSVEEITLFPARRVGEGFTQEIEAPELRQAVLRFLARRFRLVQEMTASSVEPIWMASSYGVLLAYREQQARLAPELPPGPAPPSR